MIWDKRNRKELEYYDILTKAAGAKGIKTAEYIKDCIIQHIGEIAKEIP